MTAQVAAGHRRHSRFWLTPALTPEAISNCADARGIEAILRWVRAGRPLVGRTRAASDPPSALPLGLALPPQNDMRPRIACCVSTDHVVRQAPPLSLREALTVLPDTMRDVATTLANEAERIGIPVGVYGSTYWHYTAGGGYLHSASDLDLIASPHDAAQTTQWLKLLTSMETRTAHRLDGEVRRPDGASLNWRELASETLRLLVRTDEGPHLATRADVWAVWNGALQGVEVAR